VVSLLVRLPDVQRYSSLPSLWLQLLRLGLFLSVLQTHSQLVLQAWANFSDCGFSRRNFLFRQEFSFSQSYRFFPSFCQALAEDRVTTPTKKKIMNECKVYACCVLSLYLQTLSFQARSFQCHYQFSPGAALRPSWNFLDPQWFSASFQKFHY